MAENKAGLLEETVGRLLNHTPTSVTGRHYVAVDYKRLHKPMTDVVDALIELDLISEPIDGNYNSVVLRSTRAVAKLTGTFNRLGQWET